MRIVLGTLVGLPQFHNLTTKRGCLLRPCRQTLRERYMGTTEDGQVFINEQENQALSGIAAGTWRNWRSAGVGPPYFKVRGRVLYKKQDVLDFIEAGRVTH